MRLALILALSFFFACDTATQPSQVSAGIQYSQAIGSLENLPTNADTSMWIIDIGYTNGYPPIADVWVREPGSKHYIEPFWYFTTGITVMSKTYRGIVVSAKSGSIKGFEYLVRWRYPD